MHVSAVKRVNFKNTLCAIFAVAFSGCSVSEQYAKNEMISRSVSFGVSPEHTCEDDGRRIKTRSLGATVGPQKMVLGYQSQDLICLPLDACSAIFFINTPEQIAIIRENFPNLPQSCVVQATTKKPPT